MNFDTKNGSCITEETNFPLVSVIIPAYNAENTISYAIDSVLEQDYKNIEIVIVDDLSSDGTVKVVEKYCKSKPSIYLLKNKSNQGPSVARNIAIDKASGKYISFLDADDKWLPNHLASGVNFLENASNVDVVFFNFNVVNYDTDNLLHDWFSHLHIADIVTWKAQENGFKVINSNMFDSLLQRSFIHLQSMIVRSEKLPEKSFNEGIMRSEDRDFSIRLFMESGAIFAFKDLVTGIYYRQNNSLTSEGLDNSIATCRDHIKLFSSYDKKYKISNEQRKIIQRMMIQRYLSCSYIMRMKKQYFSAVKYNMKSFGHGFSFIQFIDLIKVLVSILLRK